MRCFILVVALVLTFPFRAWAGEQRTDGEPVPVREDRAALPHGALARLGTTRYRIPYPYSSFDVSKNGRHIALVGESDHVLLLDLPTWTPRFRLMHSDIAAAGAAFTPDGKSVVTWEGAGVQFHCWDTATGRRMRRFGLANAKPSTRPLQVAFARDGTTMVSVLQVERPNPMGGQFETDAVVWDIVRGKQLRAVTCSPFVQATSEAWALSPDGRLLALPFLRQRPKPPGRVGTDLEKSIQLLEVTTGKEVVRIETTHLPVALGFSPDGKHLAAASALSALQVFAVPSGKLVQHFRGRRTTLPFLHYAPDGKSLFRADSVHGLLQWDVRSGELRKTYAIPEGTVARNLYDLPGGKTLALGTRKGSALVLWELESGKLRTPKEGHFDQIDDLRFTPRGELVSAGRDGLVIFWNTRSARALRTVILERQAVVVMPEVFAPMGCRPFHHEEPGPEAIQLAPRGELAAVNDIQGIHVHELKTGKVLYVNDDEVSQSSPVTFVRDGMQVASVIGKRLHHWDARTGRSVHVVPSPLKTTERATQIHLAPDGRTFAFFLEKEPEGQSLLFWDARTHKRLRTIELQAGPCCFTFAPGGGWAALSLNGGKVTLIRLDQSTGDLSFVPGSDAEPVTALAYSPDGRTLAVATAPAVLLNDGREDSRIYLFEVASRTVRRSLRGHIEAAVQRLAFSPDGTMLASAGFDTSILLWPAGVRAVTAKAPPRPLTPKEADALWQHVRGANAVTAFDAMRSLTQAPQQAIRLIARDVPPAPKHEASSRQMAQWIDDLASDDFATRRNATRSLELLGKAAAASLRAALPRAKHLEARRRVQELLSRATRRTLSTKQIAHVRAVELLEALGTPAARDHLARLAGGDPNAILTHEARAALERASR